MCMRHDIRTTAIAAMLAMAASTTWAKLPPPNDEAKAKAAETAAKTAHTGKVDSYKLCMVSDRIAGAYHAGAKANGKPAAAAVATPPCVDPGAFVYTPPAETKPIEAAGAHSPAATAASPPSTTTPAASIAPKK